MDKSVASTQQLQSRRTNEGKNKIQHLISKEFHCIILYGLKVFVKNNNKIIVNKEAMKKLAALKYVFPVCL